ncbi:MAG: von Willebrand factor type A domain-containing protein [Bacteroidales bacterium]
MKNSFKIFAILVMFAVVTAFIGSVTITGTVKDSSGKPVAGVIVSVKGISKSVITDAAGKYRITIGDNETTLVFSLTGYSPVEEEINGRTVINVVMNNNITVMDEVVAAPVASKRDMYRSYEAKSMASPSVSGGAVLGVGRYNQNFNTEGYAAINENGFRDVNHNPLSTFSIDVDNASYSNVRRFINLGELPPADAVRIEEMINYFKYNYPEPEGEHPFSVYTEMATCPWNTKHLLLHVGLKGKSIDKSSLPPSNIVFLIDVSGSMDDPNKLPLLKSAFGLLVNELRAQDRVAIVVYAGAAGLVLESTPGNKKELIMKSIDNLEAGGSTAGGEGLKLAYAEAEKNFIPGGNNRIILATDGDFNVGESSNGGMEKLIEKERTKGVFITVLGFGMGNYKDDKMEIIADKGNGNYAYIDNLQEARRVLVKEFGGTLFTIAKDVKFQIEFNPARIASYRLIGYENRLLNDEDFNDDKKDAGEMGSGHNVTALYELIPSGSDEIRPTVDPLKYQKRETIQERSDNSEYLNIKLRYKKPDGVTSMLLEKPVKGGVKEYNYSSENLRFAAAVSEFGMILRNSEFKGSSTIQTAIDLANGARGTDEDGYRAELVRLMKTVREMKLVSERD